MARLARFLDGARGRYVGTRNAGRVSLDAANHLTEAVGARCLFSRAVRVLLALARAVRRLRAAASDAARDAHPFGDGARRAGNALDLALAGVADRPLVQAGIRKTLHSLTGTNGFGIGCAQGQAIAARAHERKRTAVGVAATLGRVGWLLLAGTVTDRRASAALPGTAGWRVAIAALDGAGRPGRTFRAGHARLRGRIMGPIE